MEQPQAQPKPAEAPVSEKPFEKPGAAAGAPTAEAMPAQNPFRALFGKLQCKDLIFGKSSLFSGSFPFALSILSFIMLCCFLCILNSIRQAHHMRQRKQHSA